VLPLIMRSLLDWAELDPDEGCVAYKWVDSTGEPEGWIVARLCYR